MNPTKKRDAPSIPRLPSPEPGDGDSSEDEEYVTLSTPADTLASIQEEVVQSTIDEPDTDPSDLSSDVECQEYQGNTSSALWAGTDKEHYNLRL